MSTSLNILFGVPSRVGKGLVENVINSISDNDEIWQKSAKIGIQIRTCSNDSTCSKKVESYHLHCFGEKIIKLLNLYIGAVPRYVFVTSDFNNNEITLNIRHTLVRLLENNVDQQVKVFDTSVINIENQELRTLLDWHLLTLMDWLLISSSSYGETASILSLKPTERFDHSLKSNTTCNFHWFNKDIAKDWKY